MALKSWAAGPHAANFASVQPLDSSDFRTHFAPVGYWFWPKTSCAVITMMFGPMHVVLDSSLQLLILNFQTCRYAVCGAQLPAEPRKSFRCGIPCEFAPRDDDSL